MLGLMRLLISMSVMFVLAACAPLTPPLRGQAQLYYKAKELIPWVSQQTGYPMKPAPNFTHVKDFGLKPKFGAERLSIHAAYDGERQLIGLGPDWWGSTPLDLSVLVHELTHHLQAGTASVPICIRDQEIEAYNTQLKYLAAFHPSATDAKLTVERTHALLVDGDCDAGSVTR